MAYGESYEEFVNKFKPKKTTDDCYTPPEVYDIIKDWVFKHYNIPKDTKIIRPFYPGGDFEHADYPAGCLVLDNPPFSILRYIRDFYTRNKINYFIFGPERTLFSSKIKDNYVMIGHPITYDNGAQVPTGFITNLGDHRIELVPELGQAIKAKQDAVANKFKQPKYKYPTSVISAAKLRNIVTQGVSLYFDDDELYFTRALDAQRALKKGIFGAGFIIGRQAEARYKKAIEEYERIKVQKTMAPTAYDHIWQLSESELQIVEELSKDGDQHAQSTSAKSDD